MLKNPSYIMILLIISWIFPVSPVFAGMATAANRVAPSQLRPLALRESNRGIDLQGEDMIIVKPGETTMIEYPGICRFKLRRSSNMYAQSVEITEVGFEKGGKARIWMLKKGGIAEDSLPVNPDEALKVWNDSKGVVGFTIGKNVYDVKAAPPELAGEAPMLITPNTFSQTGTLDHGAIRGTMAGGTSTIMVTNYGLAKEPGAIQVRLAGATRVGTPDSFGTLAAPTLASRKPASALTTTWEEPNARNRATIAQLAEIPHNQQPQFAQARISAIEIEEERRLIVALILAAESSPNKPEGRIKTAVEIISTDEPLEQSFKKWSKDLKGCLIQFAELYMKGLVNRERLWNAVSTSGNGLALNKYNGAMNRLEGVITTWTENPEIGKEWTGAILDRLDPRGPIPARRPAPAHSGASAAQRAI